MKKSVITLLLAATLCLQFSAALAGSDLRLVLVSRVGGDRVPAGSNIVLKVSGAEESDRVSYYLDGEKVGETNGGAEHTLALPAGKHEIHAADEAGRTTQKISLRAVDMTVRTNKISTGFEGSAPLAGLTASNADKGTVGGVFIDGDHGQSLEVSGSVVENIRFETPKIRDAADYVRIDYEVMYSRFINTDFAQFKTYPEGAWIYTFKTTSAGDLKFVSADGEIVLCSGLSAENWYKFTLIFDIKRNQAGFLLDDRLLMYGLDMTGGSLSGIDYAVFTSKTDRAGDLFAIYYDNFSLEYLSANYDAEFYALNDSGELTDGAVDHARPRLALQFTEEMNAATLVKNNFSIVDSEGIACDYDLRFDSENRLLYFDVSEPLLPSEQYCVVIGNRVSAASGAAHSGDTILAFVTTPPPFGIVKALVADGVTVTVKNGCGDPRTAVLLVTALNAAGGMTSVNATRVALEAGASDSFFLPVDTTGAARYRFYLIESYERQTALDMMETKA